MVGSAAPVELDFRRKLDVSLPPNAINASQLGRELIVQSCRFLVS